ncbi:hypothetical protein Cgig2_032091 [Carnegiea gigantea]|uniref:Uncharacterized protein n=1 Tax=Carnegiea gigantea TaxID=171969 RepID=A0A9Q1JS39_9CARY|nr:hypothetical protein Cgig2_032091 [Carnegiea gigantea]
MGNKINEENLLNLPQQLHQRSNNIHTVHIAKGNLKALYLIAGDMGIREETQPWDKVTIAAQAQEGDKTHRFIFKDPTHLLFSFSPKGAANASIVRVYYQRTKRATENASSLGKSQGSTKHMHKVEKEKPEPRNTKGVHGMAKPPIYTKKGKEVVVRQQPKRIVKEMPFLCRSPFLKDYREARDRLKPSQMMLVDYAFLPPNDLHPST